jgi:hypothetical protein
MSATDAETDLVSPFRLRRLFRRWRHWPLPPFFRPFNCIGFKNYPALPSHQKCLMTNGNVCLPNTKRMTPRVCLSWPSICFYFPSAFLLIYTGRKQKFGTTGFCTSTVAICRSKTKMGSPLIRCTSQQNIQTSRLEWSSIFPVRFHHFD